MHRHQRFGYTGGSDSDGSTPRDERCIVCFKYFLLRNANSMNCEPILFRFSTPRLSARMGGSSSDGEYTTPRSQVDYYEGEHYELTPRDVEGYNELKRSSSHAHSELKDHRPPQPSPRSHALSYAEPKNPEHNRDQLSYEEQLHSSSNPQRRSDQQPSSRSAMLLRQSYSEVKETDQRWSNQPPSSSAMLSRRPREADQRLNDEQPPSRSATLAKQSYSEVEERDNTTETDHQILDIFSFARHSRVDEVHFQAIYSSMCLAPF